MSSDRSSGTPAPAPRRRRESGDRSRTAILKSAAELATLEGLNGLSIGRLAEAVGMSKSGLFAHFGSKEQLQLDTVAYARGVFAAEVIEPVDEAAGGIARLRGLTENFLRHVEGGVFPGGCFFASATAELDSGAGPVRDQVLEVEYHFLGLINAAAHQAQQEGDIDTAEDVDQLVFDLHAFMLLANMLFVLTKTSTPMDRARRSIERRLAPAG
jgi:AcrR family transcriptional regulator